LRQRNKLIIISKSVIGILIGRNLSYTLKEERCHNV
jgi:hypothetical protein